MGVAEKRRKVLQIKRDETRIVEESVPTDQRRVSRSISAITTAVELGFSISLPIAGGALLGAYLDKRLGTSPKLTLSLLFLGLFIGVYHAWRLVTVEFKE